MLGGFYKEAAPFRLVGQVGREPTMVKPADLQSAALPLGYIHHDLVRTGGGAPRSE